MGKPALERPLGDDEAMLEHIVRLVEEKAAAIERGGEASTHGRIG